MVLQLLPLAVLVLLSLSTVAVAADGAALSHPPLRTAPAPAKRPMATSGKAYFVDAARGNDAAAGTQEAPWQTVNFALGQLAPGDTLYLRGGTYYERVYVALVGEADKPITLRSYPGEQAVLDGGLREFFENPAEAWDPVAGSKIDEYRSQRAYRNLRHVLGSFGDSMIGLNTYYHRADLQATNEFAIPEPENSPRAGDIQPLYCGPGVWYDAQTGHIHCRLSHTHLQNVPNYTGPADPRTLPLVLAAFGSVPLTLDGAQHVQLQDLVIRGAGYDAVVVNYGIDVTFDNCTIWCGTYGLKTANTGPLKFYRSGLYGNCPPWLARSDTSKRAYPGRPQRDITRLNTHSCWVIEAGREFSVYAHPCNDDFDVSYSEFTDCHDGPYFGGVGLNFHHNLIENMQDDGIYLSQMYPRHLYMRGGAELRLYENVFRQCLTAIAFGGVDQTADDVFLYRNVFDLRQPVYTARAKAETPDQPGFTLGFPMGDHGSPPWPAMKIYHNTVFVSEAQRSADARLLSGSVPERQRMLLNNIIVHGSRLAGLTPLTADRAVIDGNLYWSPETTAAQAAAFFNKFRGSAAYEESKKLYPPGLTTSSLVADPQFQRVEAEPLSENDYRLKPGSPAIDAGAAIPAEWPDSRRDADKGRPDIGAIPVGAAPLQAGRAGTP